MREPGPVSRPVRLLLALWGALLPREFREALLGDLFEGLRRARRRGRGAGALWLLGEMLRTPYVGLWRQAARASRGRERRGTRGSNGNRHGRWRTGMGTTLKVAVRVLGRRPGFAAVAVGTLTLSVGAATLIFGLLEAVLLRPLPYPGGDRLYIVYGTNTDWRDGDQELLRDAWDRAGVSMEMARAWNAAGPLEVGTYQQGSAALGAGDGPEETVAGARVDAGFFPAVGVAPILGRLPTTGELSGREPVVVIHEDLWSRELGRDANVLGRTVQIEGRAHTVVGVMPREFELPSRGTRWWAPFPPEWNEYPDATILNGVARVPPGTTASSAAETLNAVVDNLASAEPAYEVVGARLVPLREEVLGSVSGGLRLLFAAVCVVVLIACVNLANLVVARGARRMPELALRSALGAGRGGLVGTMLTEVGVVCLVGALLGVGLAAGALEPLAGFLSGAVPGFPGAEAVSLNMTVLGFALGVTLLTALLAGLPPALSAARRAPAELLQGARRGGRSRGVRRVQRALLFTEAGLAMLLLGGAGLLARSMARVLTLDPGFDSRGIAYVALQLPEERFPDATDALRALDELKDRLARVPEVEAVVEARSLPSLGGSTMTPVRRDGAAADDAALVVTASVGPGYFPTLGIPLLRGRGFDAGDVADAPAVAVLSASLARRLFGDEDPVGRTVLQASGAVMTGGRAEAGNDEVVQVVGVVGDVRQIALVRSAGPILYRPFRQGSSRYPVVAMATEGDPGTPLEAARAAAAGIDGAVIRDLGTLREGLLGILGPVRVRTVLLGALAALAAALAMVGIYGVVSYVVSDRRREIGVRMALGARSGGEATRMVRHALTPCLAGAALGVVAALALSRVLESSIFEISRLDPLSYASAFGLLMAVAALAAWWPARRAARVDPMEVLAGE